MEIDCTADNTSAVDSMESEEHGIKFYKNPYLSNLNFIEKDVSLFSNLYKIIITRNKELYQYSLDFKIVDGSNIQLSTKMKRKIINMEHEEINKEYGTYLLAGDTFYSEKKLDDIKEKIIKLNNNNYSLIIKPTKETISLKTDINYMMEQYKRDGGKVIKTIFEIMIKEILRHNPSLKYVMKLFGNKDKEELLEANDYYNDIKIMPGFVTKVMVLENGFYLNVDIKTKIMSKLNCLQLIESFCNNPKKITREEKKKINNWFQDKIIETSHSNQRFRVDLIDFEKKANIKNIKIGQSTKSYYQYYKETFNIEIDKNSPLIIIKQKGKNELNNKQLFPPEVCNIVGLSEEMINDKSLLNKIYEKTKLTPNDKIENINDILSIINEKTPITKVQYINGEKIIKKLQSSYEKKNDFGIDILEAKNEKFEGQIMESPFLIGKNNIKIKNSLKPFKVIEPKEINFICLYHKDYEQSKRKFFELVKQSINGYGLIIGKKDYRALNTENINTWKKEIEKCGDCKKYNIIIVMIDDYLNGLGLYDELKLFANEKKGIITQFVLTNSFSKKNGMSVVSNILIQMNVKIGGISYKVDFDKQIQNMNLMIVGINSSRIIIDKTLYQSLSYCATLNNDFTEYTNKKENVNADEINKGICISNFINEALTEYFKKNNKMPGGIIIYRQGISEGKEFIINTEIEQINMNLNGDSPLEYLKGLKIPYYYILVNKRSSIKFFEIDTEETLDNNNENFYQNPENGLLVTRKAVRNDVFEYYIQPQKVNQGTATPTNYRVMYGTMNMHNLLPKLSFDLCFLYSNWRGPVRIPAPLKYAEKLAKIKYMINEDIKNSLCYI